MKNSFVDLFGASIKSLDRAVMKDIGSSNEVQTVIEKFYFAEVTKLLLEASKKDWWPNAAEHIAFLLYCRNYEKRVIQQHKEMTALLQESVELQSHNKELRKELTSLKAQNAVEVRHSKPGGSREKRESIRAIWASGKYSSRDICAEQECAALGMSFSAVRKALRNTPDAT